MASRVRSEKLAVSEAPSLFGICTSCANAPSCIYAKGSLQPVLDCEEFEGSLPGSAKAACKVRAPARSFAETSAEEAGKSLEKGLCLDCDHRGKCTSPRPEGGIWHCEEYA